MNLILRFLFSTLYTKRYTVYITDIRTHKLTAHSCIHEPLFVPSRSFHI